MALLTKVKTRMAVHAHRKVRGLLDGAYASVQLGRSMDFFDLREYVTGDDVKDIDWKASARKGEMLIKRFVADRKHTILLVVATSRTMAGMCDAETSKRDVAVFASGVLGWLATRHGDWVSLVYADRGEPRWVRPSSREDALERMLQQIQAACDPAAPEPDLDALLDHVVTAVRRRTILVVITDDVELDAATERRLTRLRAQHEVLWLTVGDLDPTDPALAGTALVDQSTMLDWPAFLRDTDLHADVAREAEERKARRGRRLDRVGIAWEHVDSENDVIPSLFTLLDRHRHARA